MQCITFLQQLRIQKKKEMTSRYTEFNLLELQSIQEFGYPESCDVPIEKGVAETKEGVEEDNMQDLTFYMKSSRHITNSYQISFQSNFMKEHESVFKRKVQNYMEFVRSKIQNINSTILNQFPKGLYGLNTKKTCEELITKVTSLSYLEKNLPAFEKLREFLNIVCNHCPQKIALELLEVAEQVLQAYQQKVDNFMSCSQVTEIGSEVASNIKRVSLLNLSCLGMENQSEIHEFTSKYSEFLNSYCVTVILVTGQFFENPYNDQEDGKNCFKRLLSPSASEDEEENYETSPLKRRKFSF